MSDLQIFPNWKRAIRNAIAVGIIAGVANFQNTYPPTLETAWSFGIAFCIAFALEFGNAYKQKPVKKSDQKKLTSFFLP